MTAGVTLAKTGRQETGGRRDRRQERQEPAGTLSLACQQAHCRSHVHSSGRTGDRRQEADSRSHAATSLGSLSLAWR